MINVALLLKSWRDTRLLLGVVLLAVLVFESLIVLLMNELRDDLELIWNSIAFVRNIVQTLVGLELSQDVSIMSLVTFGFVHPFLLAVTWAYLIAVTTGHGVGEIDRGTADLLLTLPISRASVYVTTSLVWIAAGIALALAAWVGVLIGERLFPFPEPLERSLFIIPVVNYIALYVAIGSGALMVSSLVRRRGLAVAIVVGVLLVSFLVNFVEAFIPAMERAAFLGVLHYYRPVEAVRDHVWPIRNLIVLGVAGVVFWSIGLWRSTQRDVPVA